MNKIWDVILKKKKNRDLNALPGLSLHWPQMFQIKKRCNQWNENLMNLSEGPKTVFRELLAGSRVQMIQALKRSPIRFPTIQAKRGVWVSERETRRIKFLHWMIPTTQTDQIQFNSIQVMVDQKDSLSQSLSKSCPLLHISNSFHLLKKKKKKKQNSNFNFTFKPVNPIKHTHLITTLSLSLSLSLTPISKYSHMISIGYTLF